MSKKTKTTVTVITAVVLTVSIIFGWFVYSGRAGTTKKNLKTDFASRIQTQEELKVKKSVGSDSAGLLAYNQNKDKISFGLYKENAIGRYAYVGGGNISLNDGEIKKYEIEDCKSAVYVSLNSSKICEIRVYDNILEPEIIRINPDRPFVLAEPKGAENIDFINVQGIEVEATERIY